MHKIHKLLLLTLTTCLGAYLFLEAKIDENKPVWKFDQKPTVSPEAKAPKKFRGCGSPFNEENLKKLKAGIFGRKPSQEGLDRLKISGSGQFTKPELEWIVADILLKNKANKMYIVDLRMETHGFIDDEGKPVSYYEDKNQLNLKDYREGTVALIKKEEGQFKKLADNIDPDKQESVVAIKKVGETDKVVDTSVAGVKTTVAKTEGALVQEVADEKFCCIGGECKLPAPGSAKCTPEQEQTAGARLEYKRFHILDHHRPADKEVDKFIVFIRGLGAKNDTWLHFHCKGGKGRTTTFMTMYDMLANARNVGFDDIIFRQHLLNGSDLTKIPGGLKGAWKKEAAEDRFIFLWYFYQYAKDPSGFRNGASWQDWLKANEIEVPYRPTTLNPGETLSPLK